MTGGVGELSLKIIRQLKLIERFRAERRRYEDSRKVDPEAARMYNLYCKRISEAKRRILKYVNAL